MFDNGKALWFILIVAFGSAMMALGANDLQGSLVSQMPRDPPDARRIIHDLHQGDVDPRQLAYRTESHTAAQERGEQPGEEQDLFERIGFKALMRSVIGEE